MLDSLITSKTRLKILLRFFINSAQSAHLRELAKDMNENTNSIRLELNKLSSAGFLLSHEEGNTIKYQANSKHSLFPEISSLVKKYFGIDKVIEDIVKALGDLKFAALTGDYTKGIDSGVIDLLLVGDINVQILNVLVAKTEALIVRKINVLVLNGQEFELWRQTNEMQSVIVLWSDSLVK